MSLLRLRRAEPTSARHHPGDKPVAVDSDDRGNGIYLTHELYSGVL